MSRAFARVGAIRALTALGSAVGLALVVYGYRNGERLAFYGGLFLGASSLVPLWYMRAAFGRRAAEFVVVAVLAFFGLELWWLAVSESSGDLSAPPVYIYGREYGDQTAFRRFFQSPVQPFRALPYIASDPAGTSPFILKAGAREKLFDSEVRINSLGFRGPEITLEKGMSYRIVALGESTTFGLTLEPGDRPWPELLEGLIAARLDCERPIQVVNAGMPGWTLANQLKRLEADVLPLEPDLLISYHGYNGFSFGFFGSLGDALPAAPRIPPRPSPLLETLEMNARLWWFRRSLRDEASPGLQVSDADLSGTFYAKFYRRLEELAAENGIPMALCTFNLAVDASSPEAVVGFYERRFPGTRVWIVANALHTRLVRDVVLRDGVFAVDTSHGVDGAYEDAFIDIVHLTQLGRERLAENVLAGILPSLAADPRLACRARDSE